MFCKPGWLLVLVLGCSLPLAGAWAQQSESPFDDGAGMPDADVPLKGGDQQQQGSKQPKVNVERFDDWAVRCGEVDGQSGERCEMFQQVTRNETDQTVMQVVVGFPPGSDRPAAIFQVPLGVRLEPGITVKIDDGKPVKFPIQICVRQGCRGDVPLEQDLLNRMRAGVKGTVVVQDPRGRGVEIPLSLMGFTDAFKRISG